MGWVTWLGDMDVISGVALMLMPDQARCGLSKLSNKK